MAQIDLGIPCDMHVHVREGPMCELVTPTIKEGGVSVAYIMPNLQPPVTSIDRVSEYKTKLSKISPDTTFLMSFYLSDLLTPEVVEEAAKNKLIHGIKCYPAGVTTNSTQGVDPNDFSKFYPIFEKMQEFGLILNLHGEKPSTESCFSEKDKEDITVLNAEEYFLPALRKLHTDFPDLRIVLEHCTTQKAIDTIMDINKEIKDPRDIRVAATITTHHLFLTIDDWAGNPINFCKPVAKLPSDKRALIDAATSGKPYFFFGSDSAPHPLSNKARISSVCAGVYTQSLEIPYLAQVFNDHNSIDKLKDFVSKFGREFYNLGPHEIISKDHCILYQKSQVVPNVITNADNSVEVCPFKAGESLNWSVKWEPVF
ncbi:hypothetical protein TPHA_0B00630 [Tetrapisispora phaffii CBS 4417]|uniref:Uncharacterized protein n=1 Tax=Tetrapisispora phaffii (strain ATCC 24235 / CBS 4417 / NBRC 1672 / NRRL Y-8282 / UCD 70-5) TaxID=1071381 RepID=G8BQD8_TETPH|nr:hypothetical protein TPHA_0B00630 [Tetrapisispora phaffii CBS 4417]CCE61735.1 hypothetical protein TPHA_0B00630 [Tetrapisispora phaffii CBS 4417]